MIISVLGAQFFDLLASHRDEIVFGKARARSRPFAPTIVAVAHLLVGEYLCRR